MPYVALCILFLSHLHTVSLFHRFWLHVPRIPQCFTAYPYSGAGVAIPWDMNICRGRPGVKQSWCEKARHYSTLGKRVV